MDNPQTVGDVLILFITFGGLVIMFYLILSTYLYFFNYYYFIFLLIVSSIFISIILVYLVKHNNIKQSSKARYVNRIFELKSLMNRCHLPYDLLERILVFIEYRFPKQSFPEKEIIMKLSPLLADVNIANSF